MVLTNKLTESFITCDIVVWNGVIAKWGSVRDHYAEGDMIRLAERPEVQQFKEKQNG